MFNILDMAMHHFDLDKELDRTGSWGPAAAATGFPIVLQRYYHHPKFFPDCASNTDKISQLALPDRSGDPYPD
jgi:hypothetical protein